MRKPFRIKFILLLFFCCPLWFFCCKKESAKKPAVPACYDFMTLDSNETTPTAAAANYYYYNSSHQLIKHVAVSGGTVAWSDTFEYVQGNMVKSLMSLGNNSTADYYTRSEYDYTDTLVTASRYYLDGELIVDGSYNYDAKGELTSYFQHSDNTTLQADPDYTWYLAYDNNGNVTQITDGSGNVVLSYQGYDDHPNLFYRMPFDFAYDPLSYFGVFSRHNAAQAHSYLSPLGTPAVSSASYTFTYTNGQVSTVTALSSGNGTVLTRVRSLCN